MVAGFKIVKRNLRAGGGETDVVPKVKLADWFKYVELAARYFRAVPSSSVPASGHRPAD